MIKIFIQFNLKAIIFMLLNLDIIKTETITFSYTKKDIYLQ
jgi:hypothetical protein